jgi:hypothetical protein
MARAAVGTLKQAAGLHREQKRAQCAPAGEVAGSITSADGGASALFVTARYYPTGIYLKTAFIFAYSSWLLLSHIIFIFFYILLRIYTIFHVLLLFLYYVCFTAAVGVPTTVVAATLRGTL